MIFTGSFSDSKNGDLAYQTEDESRDDGRTDTKKRASTVYTNPEWKEDLRSNFKELIVQKCSEATKAAFEENVDVEVIYQCLIFYIDDQFQDLRSKKIIRTELMDSVSDYMIVTYGGVASPSKFCIFVVIIVRQAFDVYSGQTP